jgi:hypothetical protein
MSLLRRKGFEPIAIWGLVVTVLLHGGAILGVILYRRALLAAQQAPPPGSYVVAKLLRLGKPRDPKKLPNKIVPRVATRKEEGIDYSADANDAPSRKNKKHQGKDSDRLRSALDQTARFAAAESELEAEGSPDGVPHGTATSAQDGDPYMTKIADLWNRNWSLPAIIPRDVAKTLFVLVVIRIDKNGTIQLPIKFDRKSGNAHFDNSIKAAWTKIKQIPLPPTDRFASILANGLALKLNWEGIQ